MLVLHHVLITVFFGFILVLNGFFSAGEYVIFVIGGLFIDVDHIFSYWYYKKEFSLDYQKIKQWCFEIGPSMEYFFPLHTIWFFILLLLLTKVQLLFIILLYGVLLHAFLDILVDIIWYYPLKKNKKPWRRWFF